jgi:hypothetical protein
MASIRYEIIAGIAPFEVQLKEGESIIDTASPGAIGTFYFHNIDDGNYTITVSDAAGCSISFSVNVDCEGTTTIEPGTTTTEPGTTTTELEATGRYYVSNSGNDSNDGLTPETPWATLQKVNTSTYQPGNAIFFKKGDSWTGTLTPPSSGTSGLPIVFSSYGSGDKPKIHGSEEITGWTLHSGNIYKATFSTDIEQLFCDGERMQLARYPNTGYHTVTSVQSTTQFTSTDLDGSIDYTGANWIGKTSKFTMMYKLVTNSSSQTITLESAPSYYANTGEGFFLANKLEFLDQAGEWYYNTLTNTVYFWSPNGDSPANYTVRGSTVDYGVYILDKSYVTVRNLSVLHNKEDGVYINRSTNIMINDNDILSPDMRGINLYSSSDNNSFLNNYIYQVNGRAISSYGNYAIITGNIIEDTGLLENINKRTFYKTPDGRAYDNFGTAVLARGTELVITYNRIINTGYIGINWNGQNGIINYNYIDGVCQVLDDGGGIYTYNGTNYNQPGAAGSEIKYNIVLNAFGNREGSTSNNDSGYGIYMDNNTHDITIQYNTVAHATCNIYLHENGHILVDNNTLMDGILLIFNSGMVETNTVTNNIFYTTSRRGDMVWWQDTFQRILDNEFGYPASFDYNSYYSHYAINDVFVRYDNFADWQSSTGRDVHSTADETQFTTETEKLFYNDTTGSKIYYINGATAEDVDGTPITVSFTLSPFTSKIVVGANLDLISSSYITTTTEEAPTTTTEEPGTTTTGEPVSTTIGGIVSTTTEEPATTTTEPTRVRWEIENAVYSSKYLDTSGEDNDIRAFVITDEGTRLYALGLQNKRIYQYNLSDAWDIEDAAYSGKYFSVSAQAGTPVGLAVSSDETKLYVSNFSDKIYQYSIGTPGDIESLSYDSKSYDPGVANNIGIVLGDSDTKMYLVRLLVSGDTIRQYSLASAKDISTAGYDSKYIELEAQDTDAHGVGAGNSGYNIYATGNQAVYQYDLVTAWDADTDSYNNKLLDVSGEMTDPNSIFFRNDGTTIYVNSATTGIIAQYKVADPVSGQYQGAVAEGGNIYVSSDYGATWTAKENIRDWRSIAISASGQYQTAVVYDGYIYISDNYGSSWTQKATSQDWYYVSMSSTGQYQTAVARGNYIYISDDYGATWTQKGLLKTWYMVAVSSTGQYQTAVNYGSYIYISDDYGATWTAKDSERSWTCISISETGQYQTAAEWNGYIYISDDYGATWTQKNVAKQYRGISVSETGKYQTAVMWYSSNSVYISDDYGATWVLKNATSTGRSHDVSVSTTGQYQSIANYGGYIYISDDYGATWTAKSSNRAYRGIAINKFEL